MFVDILILIVRKWRWIALNGVLCLLAAFGVSNLVSKTYTSTAVIKLSDDNASNVSAILDNLPIKGLPLGGSAGGSNSKFFLEILGSREVLIPLVRRNRLDTVYKRKNLVPLLKMLSADLSFAYSESGVINVSYETSDSIRVCSILKDVILLGSKRYDTLQRERIQLSLGYLRDRERESKDTFEMLQDTLIQFYRKNKIFNAEEQTRRSLEVIASAEASKMALEIQDDVEKNSGGASSAFRAQLSMMKNGYERQIRGIGKGSVFVDPTRMLPLIMEEKKMVARLGLFASAYQAVVKERMITEAKMRSRIDPVQVIQAPYVPDWKSKPKRAMWMLTGLLTGIVISSLFYIISAIFRGAIPIDEPFADILRKLKESFSQK